tara:strand:- start:201 stop:356 length:156 start_codon:yes stop_codon:yes gene_type:complete
MKWMILILFLASCSNFSKQGQMGFYADQRKSKPVKWQCVSEDFLNIKCKEK